MKARSFYANTGVDIREATRFVQMIQERTDAAWPNFKGAIGGFAGRVDVPLNANQLAVSMDGIGSKILIASLLQQFGDIGEDAVSMNVGDVYCDESIPIGVIDDLTVAKLRPELHIEIIESIIRACKKLNCRLLGGETEEIPDLFREPWMVHLSMTCIGFPSPDLYLFAVQEGQTVYGWPSNGVAASGFMLVREVFGLRDDPSETLEKLEHEWDELSGRRLGDVLLEPTPSWINHIEVARAGEVNFSGHAHITGGGFDNITRSLPPDLKVVINRDLWHPPEIFQLIQRLGVSLEEIEKVLNMGVIWSSIKTEASKSLEDLTEVPFRIGQVEKREGEEAQVEFIGSYQ